LLFTLLGAVGVATAGGVAACPSSPALSSDGTTVYGGSCSEEIVVTSPKVRVVFGGDGADVIHVNANVEEVFGGNGDDAIYGELPSDEGGPIVAPSPGPIYTPQRLGFLRPAHGASAQATASKIIYGGIGSQTIHGGAGSDNLFGQRGNDTLYGEEGNDALYGGIGDDFAYGNQDDDLLSGGLGTETLDGNNGNDLVRGDATTDTLKDTGGSGLDTVSFTTAAAPGFHGTVSYSNFPGDSDGEERGVSVRLDGGEACIGYQACNNVARYGGGNDTIEAGAFENAIGSPFADLIIGGSGANRLDGGGGADVVLGGDGNDTLYGGAEGDFLAGEGGSDSAFGQAGTDNCAVDTESQSSCSGSSTSVTPRNRALISAGLMVDAPPTSLHWSQPYLVGSTAHDDVVVSFTVAESGVGHVIFSAQAGSASFNVNGESGTETCIYEAAKVDCALPAPSDGILLSGLSGDDTLSIQSGGFPDTTLGVLLGGEGSDEIKGSASTEDLLFDGTGFGSDTLLGYSYDDGFLNNEGVDNLQGGKGNDLLVSATTCDGDTLQGAESGEGDGTAENSASWAQLPTSAGRVTADLETGTAGNTYSKAPGCAAGSTSSLKNIDDLEASNQDDAIYGNGAANNLLGRPGKDSIFGRAGADNLEAADGEADSIGGGEGTDTCSYDKGVDTVNGCP